MWNCFGAQKWHDNFRPVTQTLYNYAANDVQATYKDLLILTNRINQDEIRSVFSYVRKYNYELFKMFYEWDAVKLKGGEFVNAWD